MANDGKKAAGEAAAKLVKSGTVIGVGTGSTVVHFVNALSKRIEQEKLEITAVTTSLASDELCRNARIRVITPSGGEALSLCVDGADEWTREGGIIKGAGGAMYPEKLVAIQCVETGGEFVLVVDSGKEVKKLGEKFPVPLEVSPKVYALIEKKLRNLPEVKDVKLRYSGGGLFGPVMTPHGNVILDAWFSDLTDEHQVLLKSWCGVVETGIFSGLASRVIIGKPDGGAEEYRFS